MSIREQMIEAIQSGNIEEVKRLKPEFTEAAERDKWLNSYPNNSVPIQDWIIDNTVIAFK